MREQVDALQKQLLKFSKVDDILLLANRLFQKLDGSEEETDRIVEEYPRREQAGLIRQYIQNTILEAIKPASTLGLPKELEEYVAFVNLQYVITQKELFEWNTFLLQDYMTNIHEEGTKNHVPISKFRKRIKNRLLDEAKNDILASVHFDIDDNMKDPFVKDPDRESDTFKLMMVRILTATKAGNNQAQKNRLLFKNPTFFAYVPGEPYVYVNSSNPDKTHLEAIARTLSCPSYVRLPLVGRHIASLRRMRIIRDSITTLNATDFYEPSKYSGLPRLNCFTVSCVNPIHTKIEEEAAQSIRYRRSLDPEKAPKEFSGKMHIRGHDVLNGLADACHEDVVEKPHPNWINKAIRRGRNSVEIRWRKPLAPSQSQEQTECQEDEMSIAGTEVTTT